MTDAAEGKQELRKSFLALRKTIAAEHPELEREIGKVLVAWLESRPEIRAVGLYMPIRNEPNLVPDFLKWLVEDSARSLALPFIEAGAMHYCRWRPGEAMELGAFRILVPKSRVVIWPDLVIGPCVGFTSAGYRLGYGGGWFDRMLSTVRPRPETMAVSYEVGCADGRMEPEPHDVAFDWIATERGVRRAAIP